MKLGEFIAQEAGVSIKQVMLLRHSTSTINRLMKRGASVEDYTVVQPIGSKYDYRDPHKAPIDIVAVVVGDRVHGVYRVIGVEREGTTYELEGAVLRQMNVESHRPERPARRFILEQARSGATGKRVMGWANRQRTPVQRSDSAFFHEIEVDLDQQLPTQDDVAEQLDKAVRRSEKDSSAARRARLERASKLPIRIEVRASAFIRNPDVVVEVLARAQGKCELCGQAAPFVRRSDGSPYLEVHHKRRLASGGEDTVENAIAACPNCHRHAHYA